MRTKKLLRCRCGGQKEKKRAKVSNVLLFLGCSCLYEAVFIIYIYIYCAVCCVTKHNYWDREWRPIGRSSWTRADRIKLRPWQTCCSTLIFVPPASSPLFALFSSWPRSINASLHSDREVASLFLFFRLHLHWNVSILRDWSQHFAVSLRERRGGQPSFSRPQILLTCCNSPPTDPDVWEKLQRGAAVLWRPLGFQRVWRIFPLTLPHIAELLSNPQIWLSLQAASVPCLQSRRPLEGVLPDVGCVSIDRPLLICRRGER